MCLLHFMYSYLLTLLSYHISCIILLVIDFIISGNCRGYLAHCWIPFHHCLNLKLRGVKVSTNVTIETYLSCISLSLSLSLSLPPSYTHPLKYLDCWLVMCQIAEVLATYQVSQSDVRKLLLKLQKNKEHLVSTHCLCQLYDCLSIKLSSLCELYCGFFCLGTVGVYVTESG